MAKTAERRYARYAKAMRRIKEDRQEHGNDRRCACFDPEVDRARGKTFSRFADTPRACSCWMCSPKLRGEKRAQEMRAPRVDDWAS